MSVWIAQWKCPSNHAALAAAWDDAFDTGDDVVSQAEAVFSKGIMNRWCGICGGALQVSRAKTVFKTMEEATPVLEAVEAHNLASRAMIEMLRRGDRRN